MIFATKNYKEMNGVVVDTWKTDIKPDDATSIAVEAGCHVGTLMGDDHIYFQINAKDKNANISIVQNEGNGITAKISGMNRFDVADALKFIVMILETQEE